MQIVRLGGGDGGHRKTVGDGPSRRRRLCQDQGQTGGGQEQACGEGGGVLSTVATRLHRVGLGAGFGKLKTCRHGGEETLVPFWGRFIPQRHGRGGQLGVEQGSIEERLPSHRILGEQRFQFGGLRRAKRAVEIVGRQRQESLVGIAVMVVFWHVVVWHVLIGHVLVVHGEGFTRAAGLPWRVGVPRIQAGSSASP